MGDKSGAAGALTLAGLSSTVTLDPRNNRPLRSSLSDSPLDGRAEGGSLVLTMARKDAVLDGVLCPVRYSRALSLMRVRIGGKVLGVLGEWA